jgi:transcriptional regulator with XRE-family HTH domain
MDRLGETNKAICEAITDYGRRCNLTDKDLAEKIGLSAGHYSRVIRQERPVYAAELVKLVAFLQMPPAELWPDETALERPPQYVPQPVEWLSEWVAKERNYQQFQAEGKPGRPPYRPLDKTKSGLFRYRVGAKRPRIERTFGRKPPK